MVGTVLAAVVLGLLTWFLVYVYTTPDAFHPARCDTAWTYTCEKPYTSTGGVPYDEWVAKYKTH